MALREGEEEVTHQADPTRKQLGEMSLQSRRRLLEDGNRQSLGWSKTKVVALIADAPMRPPSTSGYALKLAMSRQATVFSHEAKRREGGQPGKPLGSIWLKGEQAVLGAEHHVVPLDPRLDQR